MSLHTSSLFIGKPTYTFDELDSTNNFATELLSKSNPSEGTVIKACFQTAGKGQIGRSWHSEANQNLLCSVILYPGFLPPNQQFLLNIAISSGIYSSLKKYTDGDLKIKWPNDIYINKKKVAGILIQNSLSGQSIQYSVAGMGINLNQTLFPEEIPNPVSIAMLKGKAIDIKSYEEHLFQHLESFYIQLKNGKYKELEESYHEKLFWKDEVHSFSDEYGNIFSGIIRGTEPDGKLNIEKEDGIHSFGFRSIKFML